MKKAKFFSLTILISLLAQNALAGLALIRDSETEKFLRDLTNPVFKAAKLNPSNIDIYIVNDDSINAFVSGGQNVFINTGLIRKFKTPDALIGVIAHETGHITGGHLARSSEGMEGANNAMLLSYLLGIGAMVSGSPDAGIALIAGGSETAQRMQMKFTRTQEEAADQYAVEYLDRMQYPATGLVKLLEFFQSEMIGYQGQIDEYLLSHPVSQKRIDLIKARTKGDDYEHSKSHYRINHELQQPMNFVLAKLEGFIDNPDGVLEKYRNNNSDEANYAKSVVLFRKGSIKEAVKLLDGLIKKYPQDGFFFEMKGQILFESGNIDEAILTYNEAVKKLGAQDGAMPKISFAEAILSLKTTDKDLVRLAISRLEEAKIFEDENPFLFKQLANAYNKIGDDGRSLLALAEFNLLTGENDKCKKYAKEAKEKLKKSDKQELLHADDLIELAKEEKKKEG